ncbi:type IVB secretion system protein IcmH/DotU [Ferribacterium limneticum]|uniref:type IVB secretion system protein IcmH/DotU n=1 Tax=Ferribacterium limneticum TaxID=76259 RepID=UPI001CF9E785|nr:type IVB secretion system protein IcmH/DotU [Ferribacterium limneticum]UCV30293.1 type IVB secretion system protein IcmH/DotU [Ferribacterium limneticum]UCV34212.1 type IVB secretion system protein IcmH/DotU [Ferribacterium limneticum]
MTTAPSLFSVAPSVRPDETSSERPAKSLVDLLYDGFYMLILLNNRSVPKDPDEFSGNIQKFLDQFERAAKKNNFNAEDIFDAKYAFCAAIDESVLSSKMNIRDVWERRPLQLVLFGDQLAGEHFFDKLEAARNGGASRINALEVFHMCLLIGFKGRYLLEGPEKLKYLTLQLGEQIAHIKGKAATFAPNWAAPDTISNAIKRDIPFWVITSVLALFGLVAYIGLDWHAGSTVQQTLSPFKNIVQLAPRAPTLTITLP